MLLAVVLLTVDMLLLVVLLLLFLLEEVRPLRCGLLVLQNSETAKFFD